MIHENCMSFFKWLLHLVLQNYFARINKSSAKLNGRYQNITRFSGSVSDSDSSSSCFRRRNEDEDADDNNANGESGLSSNKVAAEISASMICPDMKEYIQNSSQLSWSHY